jgi:hypothetical protein
MKSGLQGHFWTRNLLRKRRVLTEEKLDEIGSRLEHTTDDIETPCFRDRHLEIVSSQSDEAVNFNLLKRYRVTSLSAPLII